MLSNENGRYLIRVGSLLLLILLSKSCEPVGEPGSPTGDNKTVLLISIDGFANQYIDEAPTPVLDSLIGTGVSAKALIPVFPSKTFPNHYTQVTGLYPENHGIISNRMYDQEFRQYFTIGSESQTVSDGKWYEGEPIWVTAHKHGLTTATMFWPGSEAEIQGIRPDYYFPFNNEISVTERILQVLEWMSQGAYRPNLITLYLEQLDHVGHLFGPDSEQVSSTVSHLDQQLGILLNGIHELELVDVLNIIIVSDHGMAAMSRERVIFLDDYISLNHAEVINWSPVLDIIPDEGYESIIFDQLQGSHRHLTAYMKDSTPEHWQLNSHRRITPIIAVADAGWSISSRAYFNQHPKAYSGGTHGYDPMEESMHGIFIAAGPSFRSGEEIGAVESVHLYELMCKLLEIKPAKNDGNLKVWKPAIN